MLFLGPIIEIILGIAIQLVWALIWGLVLLIKMPFKQAKERKREREREERERRLEEERKQEEREKHRQKQEQIYQRMKELGENSLSAFESLPKYLESAASYLNRAEQDFSDNALSPFWESIENAYIQLGNFNEGMHNIRAKLSNYESLAKEYESNIPAFALSRNSINKLDKSYPIYERANELVRKAQKNPDFANIYEMRRTQKILIAGFSNLSEAINNMGREIKGSINDLSESMNSTYSRLDDLKNTVEVQTNEIKAIDETERQENEGRKKREEKALNMLDDLHRIQRKKHAGY
jgi:tetratricopeptide (TPR) repeat protein